MESWRRGEEGIISKQPLLFPLRRRDTGKPREFCAVEIETHTQTWRCLCIRHEFRRMLLMAVLTTSIRICRVKIYKKGGVELPLCKVAFSWLCFSSAKWEVCGEGLKTTSFFCYFFVIALNKCKYSDNTTRQNNNKKKKSCHQVCHYQTLCVETAPSCRLHGWIAEAFNNQLNTSFFFLLQVKHSL